MRHIETTGLYVINLVKPVVQKIKRGREVFKIMSGIHFKNTLELGSQLTMFLDVCLVALRGFKGNNVFIGSTGGYFRHVYLPQIYI